MKSQETFHYTFQGFNTSNFEFTAFLFVLSLLLAYFYFDIWLKWIVNSVFPAIPIPHLSLGFYSISITTTSQTFSGQSTVQRKRKLKGLELRTKQTSSIFCYWSIVSASLEICGNIIKAVQYWSSCWYSAKYYFRIPQVIENSAATLIWPKVNSAFPSVIVFALTGRVLPGASKPACNEKKRPKEPSRLVNITADMETKEMRTRESARLGMSNGFYDRILLPWCSFICMHFLEHVNMRIIPHSQ